jgi:hypothetical protein
MSALGNGAPTHQLNNVALFTCSSQHGLQENRRVTTNDAVGVTYGGKVSAVDRLPGTSGFYASISRLKATGWMNRGAGRYA